MLIGIKKQKAHLEKTYLEELSYKLWNTKGTRFVAHKRLTIKSELSNKALAFLSVYLIILSLLSVYQIIGNQFISDKLLAFGSTSLSILLLLFSQLEYSQDYKSIGLKFHECALEISELYNDLRIFKTLKERTNAEKEIFCEKTSNKYLDILKKYQNHEDIDYRKFLADNSEYYKLNLIQICYINLLFYFHTYFLYHLLITSPPLLFVGFYYNKS